MPLDNGKVLVLRTKIITLYDTTWGRPPYWLSTNVCISEAEYGYLLQDGFQPTCRQER